MVIVQVITLSEPIGGAQMVLYNNSKAMADAGHEVHILVGANGSLTKRMQQLNVNIHIVPYLQRNISPITDMRCYKQLKNQLKVLNPDIVISHSSKAGILCRLACNKLKIKNIFTIHGWSFTPGVKGIKRYFFLGLEKIMGYFSNYFIAVSQFDADLAKQYNIAPENKIKVIYNGSPDFYNPPPAKQSKTLRIIMAARFSYQKDHETLFKAIAKLKNENLVVDLVGNGELLEHFKQRAIELEIDNVVTFHGETDNMPMFLNNADIFVLTSRFEGLPLSICEAMSVGLPVLATRVGGIHEMVINDYNGYTLPKEDHIFLAEKLERVIRDEQLRKSLGKNARKAFEEKFSIDQMAKNTIDYCKNIVEETV